MASEQPVWTLKVSDGIVMDHSGQYAAVGPFEYAGP